MNVRSTTPRQSRAAAAEARDWRLFILFLVAVLVLLGDVVGPLLVTAMAPKVGYRWNREAGRVRRIAAGEVHAEHQLDDAPDRISFIFGEKLLINRVDAATLRMVPGIGPGLADRIVAHRAGHGRIDSIDALTRVPGIGPATAAKVQAFLSFE